MAGKTLRQTYHAKLQGQLDELVHRIYDVTENFPKYEQFGLTSQLRRASLSIVLNYIEGFARQRSTVYKHFLEISYGSLKETKYLISFCFKRNLMKEEDVTIITALVDDSGKMLWGILRNIKQEINSS